MQNRTSSRIGAARGHNCSLGLGLFLLLPALALYDAAAQPASSERPAATASAERLDRELLNSERIEQQFGSYGIEVLHSDEAIRASNLYSGDGRDPTTRTFAVVLYPADVEKPFAREHAEILDGGSIGSVFVRNGWSVAKAHRYFGEVEASGRVAGLMRASAGRPLAVHVYVLSISKDDVLFDYATIAEIHHPDYLRLDDLRRIYGAPEFTAADADPLVRRILDAAAEHVR